MLNWAFGDPLRFSRPIWPWLVLPPMLATAGLILATVGMSSAFGEVRPSPGEPTERQERSNPGTR